MALIPLRLIRQDIYLNFLGKKWIAFSFSILLSLLTVVLLFTKGLNLGIDFTGGIVIEARLPQKPDMAQIREVLVGSAEGEIGLQSIGHENDIMIRLQRQPGGDEAQPKAVDHIKSILAEKISPEITYRKVDSVGPQVGEELIQAGALSLVLSFITIMIYIWIRFEWQYGVGAIIALIHDAWITVGLYCILGLEFNLTSVAALLTIVGYSINDSVVIYDRIRENMRKYKKMPMEELLNKSISETLSRTVLTATTAFLAMGAMALFGGDVIHGFSVAMMFGIAFGTYSSIYISAPVLIFLRLRKQQPAAAAA